jgi:hypothetical protein
MKKKYVIYMFLLLFVAGAIEVKAANSTVFITGKYYNNNSRTYDFNLSFYNTTGFVQNANVTSTLTNIVSPVNNTISATYQNIHYINMNNSVFPSSNLSFSVRCTGTCETRLNITYANGSSVLTPEYSNSGDHTATFTGNISRDIPVTFMVVQAKNSVFGGAPGVQVANGADLSIPVYIPGHINISLVQGSYSIYANDTRYAITNESKTFSSTYENFTYTFYTTNSIGFFFFDEITGSLLNNTTVSAYVTSSVYSINFTTTNGTSYRDLLIPATYTITYSAIDYNQREYIYELVNQSTTTLYLYLINDSADTIVLATIFDTVGRRVEGANIYTDKKNLSGTNYYTVETCTTNALGQCLLHVDLYDTTYQFRIEYNGEFVFNSQDTKVSSTAISFTIVTSNSTLQIIYGLGYFEGDLNYSNSTSTFTYLFNDTNDIFDSVCLKTVIRTDNSYTNNNSNCSTSSSGTLTLVINSSIGDEWTAVAYGVTTDGTVYQLDSLSIVVDEFLARFGKPGLFYFGFLLLGAMMFTALIHPIIPPILGGTTVWVLNSLGFIGVGSSAVISLIAVVIIIVMINKRT